MKRFGWTSLAAMVLLAGSAGSAWADRLFAVSGAGNAASVLYELDPTNGSVLQTIGATGFSHVTGLDFNPTTGVLYGVVSDLFGSGTTQLITIDVSTGAGTVVGNTASQIPDIGFNSSGTLYAWVESGPGTDQLATINLATGAVTIIGSNFGTAQTGLAFSPGGTLYVKSGTTLETVDPTTGNSTASLSLSGVGTLHNMLAFDSAGVMYSGFRSGATFTLVTVDPTTGVVTTIGTSGLSQISALAFQPTVVPEPSTIALFGLGVAGLCAGIRRRRAARAATTSAK